MKKESLEKGQKILNDIEAIKSCREMINNQFITVIKGHLKKGEEVKDHFFYMDEKLLKIIDNYLEDNLKELEVQFEEL